MVVGSNPTGCNNDIQIYTKDFITIITVVMHTSKKVKNRIMRYLLKSVEQQKDSNV